MMNPLVSIIVPVYNVDKYISYLLDSILDQSYKNFEVIVIDDGSHDKTYEIISEYGKKDLRVKFFKNEKNEKIVFTLNRALSIAKGELILRCDGDDYISKDRLLNMVDYLLSHKNISLVSSSVIKISSEGKIINTSLFRGDKEYINKIFRFQSPVLHIWLTYKCIYDDLNGYRNIPGAEDYDFILRLLSGGLEITNLTEECSYFVRLDREGNTESLIGVKQYIMKWMCYKFYNERILNNGRDSYTPTCCNEIKIDYYSSNMFAFSNVILKDIIKSSGLIKGIKTIAFLPFILLSPYHYRIIYEVIASKLIKRFF